MNSGLLAFPFWGHEKASGPLGVRRRVRQGLGGTHGAMTVTTGRSLGLLVWGFGILFSLKTFTSQADQQHSWGCNQGLGGSILLSEPAGGDGCWLCISTRTVKKHLRANAEMCFTVGQTWVRIPDLESVCPWPKHLTSPSPISSNVREDKSAVPSGSTGWVSGGSKCVLRFPARAWPNP